jgi:hypothetical protein
MRGSRGTALPETAIVLSMVLLLLFGAVQLSIIGFYQSMSDGAAFVAAHTQSLGGGTGGPQVAATVFPQVKTGDVTMSNPTSSTVEAEVAKSTLGLLLVPGAASTVNVNGNDIEPKISGVFSSPAPFQFSVTSQLTNWCQNEWQGATCSTFPSPTTYSIYLAQTVNTQGNGQGWNGPFAEWRCHQEYFASVNFPNALPTPGATWDVTNNKSPENPIYSWDPNPPGRGKQQTCK